MSKQLQSIYAVFCVILGFFHFSWANTSHLNLPDFKATDYHILFQMLSNSHSHQIEARYLYDDNDQKAHLILGSYGDPDYNYAAVPEAFKQISVLDSSVSFGRKISYENQLDRTFNLGLFNPYFTTDYLQYTPQGLLGLHTETSTDKLKLGLNYYPLFLPNQGAVIKEENGKIVGPTPWIVQTPKSFISNGERRNIHYNLEDNDYSEVVNKSGYTVYLKAEPTTSPVRFQTAYSYSPINEIVLSRNIEADLDLNSLVNVYPVVRYSEKVNSDIVFKHENMHGFVSYMLDRPQNKLESNNRTVQFLSNIEGVGVGFGVQLYNTSLEVSYARFTGGKIIDIDSDGQENDFTLGRQRLLFQEPFKIRAQTEIMLIKRKPFTMEFQWTYDQTQSGSLLSYKAHHEIIKSLFITIGFDLLGVDEVTSKNENSFLAQHQSDDRWTGGLQYVF